MRKGFPALTALAWLVAWSTIASAQAGDAPKAPATPAPAPAPAEAKPKATTPEKAPAPQGEPTPLPEGDTAPADSTGGSETPEAPAAPPRTVAPSLGVGLYPPSATEAAVAAPARPAPPPEKKSEDDVLAEDWWSHARPLFEIHGYFRTRAELFQNFSLGRLDDPNIATWPRPADDTYTTRTGTFGPFLCTVAEAGGNSSLDNPSDPARPLVGCKNKTQAGANIRFRLDPELHISDNLRILSQIDILDNVVLGSSPTDYAFQPAATGGGYQVTLRNGYSPVSAYDQGTVPPASGVNSLQDSIRVKRAWAEYSTPVGQLRFGRMPDNFGLGMVHNSADGYDDDYQSTIDRLQFITALKPLDLYLGGSWDFPSEGPISKPVFVGGQPYDLAQLDDVNQWSLIAMRKQSPELVKNALAHGQVVVNGGAYVTYRKQLLANDQSGPSAIASNGANVPNVTPAEIASGFARRNANIWTPDLWLQLRYMKFRFDIEAAAILGTLDSTETQPGQVKFIDPNLHRKLEQWGFALQLEQRLVEDKLKLAFDTGWASGDANAFNPDSTNNLIPQQNQQPVNSDKITTFRFNPAYRVDLILNRNLLQRIQGVYYFKPSVEYDFMRKPSGQRLGGGAGVIWTRASEFVQTPGHARDLGIELDGRLYFQSKDGSLNDTPGRMGGFYAMLEYGVLFPLSGLGYQEVEKTQLGGADTSAAQILRLYMGVLF